MDSKRTEMSGSRSQKQSSYYRPITPNEQTLYDHLLHWIDRESSAEMLARFQALFIQGACADAEVNAALKAVITSKLAAEDFRYVLNRCCHILINRWQARSQTQPAILELIKLFETPPRTLGTSAKSASVRRLHELTRQFTQTDQYQTLTRLSQVLSLPAAQPEHLGTLIRRYPYLYGHCLLGEDSTQEQQSTVQQIQATRQRQFEVDLTQYVTYRIRCRRADSLGQSLGYGLGSHAGPAHNPTLLDDSTLSQALRHYMGKVDGHRTHRDQAINLMAGSPQSFAGFKDDLYDYLTASIDSGYGKRRFNNHLHCQLQLLLPESNAQPLNDFLLVRTCSQMLSFLVLDSAQQSNHYVFVDLLTNLGAVTTTGLLLKIVLLCRKVLPGLEKRFSVLFNHYEAHQHETVQWLVQALENLNLALTTNFGSISLPLFANSTRSSNR